MQVAAANAEAGQLEAGLEILRELISSTEQSGQHWLDAELHRSQGELLLRLGPPDVSMAEDAFRRALEIARTQQTKTFELRSAIGLAHLYRANGRAGRYPSCSRQFLLISTRREISPKSRKRKPCSSRSRPLAMALSSQCAGWHGCATQPDTHHVSTQGLIGIAALHPSYGSLGQSFRLAENVSALPLLTAMRHDRGRAKFKAAGNAAADKGGLS